MYPHIEQLFQRSRMQKKYHLSDMQLFYRNLSIGKLPPIVHIAGTNGKGSVCHKISYALSKAGYKVALYTSPHYTCVTERMQINHENINKKVLDSYLGRIFHQEKNANKDLSFFEILTLAFFLFLSEQDFDIAIVETGLGGRLDATNIVIPILSVITSIGMDHCEILGNTLDAIAREKAGIIKDSIPVILGPSALYSSILEIAKEKQSEVIFAPPSKNQSYDEENSLIAKEALKKLKMHGFYADEENLSSLPQGRLEEHEVREKKVILDAAHNPCGFKKMLSTVQYLWGRRKIHLLFSCSYHKDLTSWSELFQEVKAIHLFPFQHPRITPVKIIEENLHALGCHPKVHLSLEEAVEELLEEADSQDLILYAGSIYPLASVRDLFIQKNFACDSKKG